MQNITDFAKLPEVLRVSKILNLVTVLYGLIGLAIWWFELRGLSFYFAWFYSIALFGSVALNKWRQYKYSGTKSGGRRGGAYVVYLICCYLAMEFGNVYVVSFRGGHAHEFPEGFPFTAIEALAVYIGSLYVSFFIHEKHCAGMNADGGGNLGAKTLCASPDTPVISPK